MDKLIANVSRAIIIASCIRLLAELAKWFIAKGAIWNF